MHAFNPLLAAQPAVLQLLPCCGNCCVHADAAAPGCSVVDAAPDRCTASGRLLLLLLLLLLL